MDGRIKLIGVVFGLLIIAAAGFVGYVAYKQANESAFEACVLSIESAIQRTLNDGEVEIKVNASEQWTQIGEEDERAIFDYFSSRNRNFDCFRFSEYENGKALLGDLGSIRIRRHEKRMFVRIDPNDGNVRRPDTEPIFR